MFLFLFEIENRKPFRSYYAWRCTSNDESLCQSYRGGGGAGIAKRRQSIEVLLWKTFEMIFLSLTHCEPITVSINKWFHLLPCPPRHGSHNGDANQMDLIHLIYTQSTILMQPMYKPSIRGWDKCTNWWSQTDQIHLGCVPIVEVSNHVRAIIDSPSQRLRAWVHGSLNAERQHNRNTIACNWRSYCMWSLFAWFIQMQKCSRRRVPSLLPGLEITIVRQRCRWQFRLHICMHTLICACTRISLCQTGFNTTTHFFIYICCVNAFKHPCESYMSEGTRKQVRWRPDVF